MGVQIGGHGLMNMFQDVEYVFGGEVRYLSLTRVREHSSRTGNGSTFSFSSYIDSLLRPNFLTSVSLHIHQNESILDTHSSTLVQTLPTLYRSSLDNLQHSSAQKLNTPSYHRNPLIHSKQKQNPTRTLAS